MRGNPVLLAFTIRGFTLLQIAIHLGLSRQSVSKWKTIPNKYIQDLSDLIEVDTIWKMKREIWEKSIER